MNSKSELIEELAKEIIRRVEEKGVTRMSFKTMKNYLNYTTRKPRPELLMDLHKRLKKVDIESDNILWHISSDITFTKFYSTGKKAKPTDQKRQKLTSEQKQTVPKVAKLPKYNYLGDFFKILFDFDSEENFLRFKSCLNSNLPIGIFLLPRETDFFSSVIERFLSMILQRKQLYTGLLKPISSKQISFDSLFSKEGVASENSSLVSSWDESSFFKFNQTTMESVIMGEGTKEIIESEEFEHQFRQLSLWTNRYSVYPFFVIFHCPSVQKIESRGKIAFFDQLIEKVSAKLPFLFTLKCRYSMYDQIPQEEKTKLIEFIKTICEVPGLEIGNEVSLELIFAEILKNQLQAINNIYLNSDNQILSRVSWGYESEEHIFLKYLVVKHLMTNYPGLSLSDILVESVSKEENIDGYSKLDIEVKGDKLIEIETLKGKSILDENVFLALYKSIMFKSHKWHKSKEFWLVLPGYEVAMNYGYVKKLFSLLSISLTVVNEIKIFFPDYYKQSLVEIDFTKDIKYADYAQSPDIICTKETEKVIYNLNGFEKVKGLYEEKNLLENVILLSQNNKNEYRGLLFFGLPGCGKTYLAEAFAEASSRKFFNINPSEIMSVWQGQSQKNIRSIFLTAKANSPSLIFFDEFDSLAKDRAISLQDGYDPNAVKNQLLIELNNLNKSQEDVIVIAATNLLSSIDSAMKRTGRFDIKMAVFPPNAIERQEIYQYYIEKEILPICHSNEAYLSSLKYNEIKYKALAEESLRFTSSDIASICKNIKSKINTILIKTQKIDKQNNLMKLFKKEIELFYTKGQLSLNVDNVEKFIIECWEYGIESDKIDFLCSEWNISTEDEEIVPVGFKINNK